MGALVAPRAARTVSAAWTRSHKGAIVSDSRVIVSFSEPVVGHIAPFIGVARLSHKAASIVDERFTFVTFRGYCKQHLSYCIGFFL